MKSKYLFTTTKGKLIEIREFEGSSNENDSPADHAIRYRLRLGKDFVVWASMGGDSGKIEM